MSIYRPNAITQQALKRQKLALFARIRENMRLKLLSMGAAVCLYIFVQADHNPTITREFNADVRYQQLPAETEVDTTQRNVTFSITGPRSLVDTIKDGDVHAFVSLQNRPLNKTQTYSMLKPYIPRLTSSQLNQLSIDQTGSVFKFRLVPLIVREKPVKIDLKPPPLGYHYGKPALHPGDIAISGWMERVKMVEKVRVDYKTANDGKIKGTFPVLLLDVDDNIVENVTSSPSVVSVNVPLIVDPLLRLVTISPDVRQWPQLPYTCDSIEVEPRRVKISGSADAVNQIFTLSTAKISLVNETQSGDIETDLLIPEGIVVQDTTGKSIRSVKVHVVIRKLVTAVPKNPALPPELPPVNPSG